MKIYVSGITTDDPPPSPFKALSLIQSPESTNMASDPDGEFEWWLLLPDSVRRLPADLAIVVSIVVLAGITALLPGVNQTLLGVVALPFVLVTPGYAVVSALFPRAPDASTSASATSATSAASDAFTLTSDASTTTSDAPASATSISPEPIERAALSFGVSIVVVAFLGLGLALTPWGVRVVPAVLAIGSVTLLATAVAATRRWALSPDERFSVSAEQVVSTIQVRFFEQESQVDTVVNVALAVSLVLATGAIAYAVAVPSQGEAYTEFYLLTENETGDLVTGDYPESFDVGETESLHVGLANHERKQMEYVVVAAIQQVSVQNDTVRVHQQQELTRIRTTVGANETWTRELNVTPSIQGERLRLVFLLYREDAPAEPSAETAYRKILVVEEAPEESN